MSNHSFDINIATEYKSVDIAILVWHFQYWIIRNKRLGRNEHEGRTWTYQSIHEIVSAFPYWTYPQVKRLLSKVIELKILMKGNFNKSKFDRTVWYAFENEEKFSMGRFRKMDELESVNGIDDIVPPIPDTLPDTLTNIDIRADEPRSLASAAKPLREEVVASSSKKAKKQEKDLLPFGAYVRLTLEQHEELSKQMGKDVLESLISDMNDWVPNNKPFKDYAAALRTWFRRRGQYVGSHQQSKLNGAALNALGGDFEKNKRRCEIAEQKLSQKFTSYVYFQAGPTSAMLINQNKDIKKQFPYDAYPADVLKNTLIQELSSCFPGARDILLGSSSQKTDAVIREGIKNFNTNSSHAAKTENSNS